MINIKHTDFIPGLYMPFKEGQLTEEKPYQFINGGYTENLTKPGWEALKKFAVGSKKQAEKSDNGTAVQGGELPSGDTKLAELMAKYEAYPHKNDKEGRAMRAEIKKLQKAEGK